MENRKHKVWGIALISILTFTTGCAITITRNHYYGYPDQSVVKSKKNEEQMYYSVDTLTKNKNGQN